VAGLTGQLAPRLPEGFGSLVRERNKARVERRDDRMHRPVRGHRPRSLGGDLAGLPMDRSDLGRGEPSARPSICIANSLGNPRRRRSLRPRRASATNPPSR
jgi:hypothetical protein